jgi:hypothetical protein
MVVVPSSVFFVALEMKIETGHALRSFESVI